MMTGALDLTNRYEDKPTGYAKDTNITPQELAQLERQSREQAEAEKQAQEQEEK